MIDPAKHIDVLVSSDNFVVKCFLGVELHKLTKSTVHCDLYIKNEVFVLFTVVEVRSFFRPVSRGHIYPLALMASMERSFHYCPID